MCDPFKRLASASGDPRQPHLPTSQRSGAHSAPYERRSEREARPPRLVTTSNISFCKELKSAPGGESYCCFCSQQLRAALSVSKKPQDPRRKKRTLASVEASVMCTLCPHVVAAILAISSCACGQLREPGGMCAQTSTRTAKKRDIAVNLSRLPLQ